METLYRKYRPIDFDTVVGQDVIVKTLRNQIVKGSTAHAYLFSGTRGTGKTTVAKIFARAINCPNEINGNPCNECPTCKAALDGTNLNIVELDAASNNGVDDIRKIIEQLEYLPRDGEKKKVFIIDEVHALSGSAAQAFLKSLEEPPEHVVFILATTDPNKLPETVLSRCQKYNFKRINIESIVAYLKRISEAEKIDIDEDALVFIAEKSDGSMRESISKLDRVRAYASSDKLTKENVLDILGIVDDDDFSKLTKAINESDIETAISVLSDCLERGKDISQFTNDFIWHLRNLLIAKDIKEPIESLNITRSNFEKLKKESELISKDVLIYFIEELSRTINLMKYDENRRVILETAFIRLASPETNFMETAVMARLDNIEKAQKEGMVYKIVERAENAEKQGDSKPSNSEEEKLENKIKEMKLTPVTMEEITKVTENWKTIAASTSKIFKTVMMESKPIPGNEKEPGLIEVQVDEKGTSFLRKFDDYKSLEEALAKSAEKIINKKIIFKLVLADDKKYVKNVTWSLDDAIEKIDADVGEEE
ncbi:MAG: DNA polymerase III subunit gamma/tau [Lachnospiraceae bacterium]|nr:DNA polymerase III subunit gamma/tau [Lachnospiraceae bacterium]